MHARQGGVYSPAMTYRLLAACALVLALCVGCGDDPEGGPRLRVETLSFDGPLPDGLVAIPIDRPGTTEPYPLVRAPGDGDGAFVVPGATAGSYRVEAPGGWRALQGQVPLHLDPSRPAPVCHLAHPHTVYVRANATTARAGRHWGAWRESPTGLDPEVIPVEVYEGSRGLLTGVRFPADAWHGSIVLVGDVMTASPGNEAAAAERGPLANPYRLRPDPAGYGAMFTLELAPTAPLVLALVPAGDMVTPEGAPLRVRVTGLPIHFEEEALLLEGTAVFPRLPSVDKDLAVDLGAGKPPLRIGTALWRRSPRLYVLDVPAADARVVRMTVPDGVKLVQVVARAASSTAFGLVPHRVDGRAITLRLPAGAEEVFLDAGAVWARLADDDLKAEAVAPDFRPTFTYQGVVRGRLKDAAVRLFRQEGDRAFSGQGFEFPIGEQGAFRGQLPLGRYLVEVASPRGVKRREQPLVVDKPQQFHVRLEAP